MNTKNLNNRNDGAPPAGDEGDNQDGNENNVDPSIQDYISRTINAASSSHASRMNKIFQKQLADVRNELAQTLSAQLTEIRESFTPGQQQKDADPEQLAAIKKQYESRLKDLEGKFDAERRAREEEKTAALRNEERSTLERALRTHGVPEERMRGAVALLFTEDKRVGRDDDGQVVFKIQRDGYEEGLDVTAGVSEWLKSEEGKHYLPARPVAGSGATGGKPPKSSGQRRTKAEALRDLRSALLPGVAPR